MSLVVKDLGVRKHKFTVDEYYQMGEAGIFNEDSRVELVEGEILHMSPIGPTHLSLTARINPLLFKSIPETDKYIVFVQSPIRISEETELQPDFQVLKFRNDFYEKSHPTPLDVVVVIEVADTSARYDLNMKLEIYCQAGVKHYCVVNASNRSVEYFSGPVGNQYSKHLTLEQKESLTVSDGDFFLTIPINKIFP